MKAIVVMYDSLNRHFLPVYWNGWVKAPNFERLAERAATFDTAYAGSLPTIPCRRELHTGRYNFLHRQWGPVEPFDDSMPEILKEAGVHTRLVSDGYHYWEDGGSTYHLRYASWRFNRGQEGEPWHCDLNDIDLPPTAGQDRRHRQEQINRRHMTREEDQPQSKTFAQGLDFLKTNHACDNWLLQIETFDPHEPFFTQQHYKDLYPHDYDGPLYDWPFYRPVTEPDEVVQHVRYEYAALVSMCDANLGKVLDAMDAYDLWRDTMLIVNTDHGHMLGEHGFWGKMYMPMYDEIVRMPLFVWDPRCGVKGERRKTLVRTIDIPATLLDYFGQPLPPDMQGKPLADAVASDAAVCDGALFGTHGGQVCVTDGTYVYMRNAATPDNQPLFNYTLLPTAMRGFVGADTLSKAALADPFPFTKGCPLLRIPAAWWRDEAFDGGSRLYNTADDPAQERPLDDPDTEARMIALMTRLMKENDAPPEQFERLGLG